MSTYCTTQIVQLAGDIFTGIGAPSSQSVGYVSGWITSSGALGQLNGKLDTSFHLSGSSPCIAGGFTDTEAAIYALLYESTYYFNQARATLAGGGSFVLSVGDGDGRYVREAHTNVAKGWRELSKDIDEELRLAVSAWKMHHSLAVDVRAEQLSSWPTP